MTLTSNIFAGARISIITYTYITFGPKKYPTKSRSIFCLSNKKKQVKSNITVHRTIIEVMHYFVCSE